MRARTTLILVVVAVILGIFVILTRRAEESGERIESRPIFPDARWDATTEILMYAAADTVHLRKTAEQWRVASDADYPADTLLVRDIFNKLDAFDRRHLRSSNPSMQETFELSDTMGTEVLLRGPDGKLAHFRVGKNGPDFRSQYIRPVGSDEVFQIPEYLRSTFDAGRATWRDRGIFSFERDRVAHLVIDPLAGDPYTVMQDDAGSFTITSPDSLPAKRNPLESALRTLATLRCDAFPDTLPTIAEAGLTPPRARVEIHLDDGAIHALDFGAEAQPARIYVRRDGAETIFLLSAGRLATLAPELETVREEPAEAAVEEAAGEPATETEAAISNQ